MPFAHKDPGLRRAGLLCFAGALAALCAFLSVNGCTAITAPPFTAVPLSPGEYVGKSLEWPTLSPGRFARRVHGVSLEPYARENDMLFFVPPTDANLRPGRLASFLNNLGQLTCHEIYSVTEDAVFFVAYVAGHRVRDGWGFIDRSKVVGVVAWVGRLDPSRTSPYVPLPRG